MAGLCIPGLQGFPIQVTGWNINKQTVLTNDISLQFSTSELPVKNLGSGVFEVNGTSTFFIGGSQYDSRVIRLTEVWQTGLFTVRPLAEIQIWGYPTATSTEQKTIAVLTIPIYQGAVNTTAGDNLIKLLRQQPVRLKSLVPVGSDINVIRYSTCVETDKNYTVNIKVAYWEKGLTITQDMVRLMPSPLPRTGIPRMSPYNFLTSYELSERGKGSRIYNTFDNYSIPYSTSLSAESSDVKKGFGYIHGFLESSNTKYDTDSYKCITINKSRDIKDGKLLIDPSTGKKLSEDIDANSAEQKFEVEDVKYSPKKILIIIASIIGCLIGLGLLIAVGYYMFKLYNSSGTIVSSVTSAVTTAAATTAATTAVDPLASTSLASSVVINTPLPPSGPKPPAPPSVPKPSVPKPSGPKPPAPPLVPKPSGPKPIVLPPVINRSAKNY